MDREDPLPYEEMDPCCQKEYDMKKKLTRLKKELRKSDRSYVRADEMSEVFGNVTHGLSTCHCCAEPADYPLLMGLRREQQQTIGTPFGTAAAVSGEEENGDEHGDQEENDDDDDDDMFADFVSEFELARRQEMQQRIEKTAIARTMGFTVHSDDTFEHLSATIEQNVPTVLHVYNRASIVSARMDLHLEKLAAKYQGTKFRRMELNKFKTDYSNSRHNNNFTVGSSADIGMNSSNSNTSSGIVRANWTLGGDILSSPIGFVCCFVKNQLMASLPVNQLGDEDGVYDSDLLQFLEQAHVLAMELSSTDSCFHSATFLKALKLAQASNRGGGDDDDNEEEESAAARYCDDPDCTRRFPHEHVGKLGGTGVGGVGGTHNKSSSGKGQEEQQLASFMKLNQDGAEALAPGYLQSL